MSGALTGLRRLVAGLMLAAMASFVLHGAAMADAHRHGPTQEGCHTSGHAHAGSKGSAHGHADGTAHVHQAHVDLGSGDHDPIGDQHAAGGDATCCSSVCSFAITAGAPDTPSVPLRPADGLPAIDQDGSGTNLGGLKRPPRTTDIA